MIGLAAGRNLRRHFCPAQLNERLTYSRRNDADQKNGSSWIKCRSARDVLQQNMKL